MPMFSRPVAILVAVLSHSALTLSTTDETSMEREISSGANVHSTVRGSVMGSSSTWVAKIVIWSSAAVELSCAYAIDNPYSPVATQLLLWLPTAFTDRCELHRDASWNLPHLVGVTLILSGALLNLSSRYSLRRFASFPIIPSSARTLYVPTSQLSPPRASDEPAKASKTWTLRHSHNLVTSGPFRYIRHPMYAGVLLSLLGTGMLYFTRGAVLDTLVDATVPASYKTVPLTVFLALGLSTMIHLAGRARHEDAALESFFEKRWTFYSWNVPYRFIPGVY